MKANRFLDLAAASRSPLFAGATRTLIILGLLLLPMFVSSSFDLVSGSTAMAGPPPDKGSGKGDLYSDLMVTYRTEHGLPILVGVPAGIEEGEGEALAFAEGYVACEQPITGFPILGDPYLDDYYATTAFDLYWDWPIGNPLLNLADEKWVSPVPLGGTGIAGEECEVAYDPGENPEYDYTAYTQEVRFGRINVGRSPDRVLDQQLREVVKTLQSGELGWDFVGRITVDGAAIDSPSQSLAIYRELMVFQGLETGTGAPIHLANLSWTWGGWWTYAAAALGSAADKGEYDTMGGVTLDLVVYNNRILDIPNSVTKGWLVIAGNGATGALGEIYIDYSRYSYTRAWKYQGCARGLKANGQPFNDRIYNLVFGEDPGGPWFAESNILGFATEADDTRRVIAFVHDTSKYIVQEIDRAGEQVVCYK